MLEGALAEKMTFEQKPEEVRVLAVGELQAHYRHRQPAQRP